jgi:Phospholipid methyltransferase
MCKNTAKRRSPAFLAETLVWVVTSSPCVFSARGFCEITCALSFSTFAFFFFVLPLSRLRLFGSAPIDANAAHTRGPHRYLSAILDQPRARLLPAPLDTLVPAALFALGQTFVVTSTWALGVTGTFLGDYFGILMDERVEGFPFNVLRDPMYVGSTMCFTATALWCVLLRSPLAYCSSLRVRAVHVV